jgi:hypothetical protein
MVSFRLEWAAYLTFDAFIRIYDESVTPDILVRPGRLPEEIDPPLAAPANLPCAVPPSKQDRFLETPIYEDLTTNVPDIAMAYTDVPFPYGPFVPRHVPKQYIENYFSLHKTDSCLQLNTTVEDLSRIVSSSSSKKNAWKLTLRRHDAVQNADIWWEEHFDAVILANGHFIIPYVSL